MSSLTSVAWKCKQSPSAMQTKKQRIKDMTEAGDNKDSQTKTDVEVPGQPAEPIRFLRLIHAQPCEESAGKTARSPSCKHTLALSITPLLTLAFPTCTHMQETAACKSFCCSTPNVFWSLEMAHGSSISKSGFVLPRNTFHPCHQENCFFSWQHPA